MSDSMMNWLEEWAGWLNALLSTGLASPTRATRQRVERWCMDAELLGFSTQQQAAQRLLRDGLLMSERTQVFFDLLLEQDMLKRLYEAQRLVEQAEGSVA